MHSGVLVILEPFLNRQFVLIASRISIYTEGQTDRIATFVLASNKLVSFFGHSL
jgi:hypothetical protein